MFTMYRTFLIVLVIMGNSIMSHPFSFSELQEVPSFELKQPSYTKAVDGCKLAYYLYAPETPRAICLLYHGAGFYGGAIYQWIGKELSERYGVATCVVDIRGHGNSGGERGDAPTIEMVWDDVSVMIDEIGSIFAGIPVYLAGHSSGAGLLLNYAAWDKHKKVDGLMLVAPYLGPMSGVLKVHTDPSLEFVKKVRAWVYILGRLSGGWLCAHTPAVYFNYPYDLLNDDRILKYYTYTMSAATTPFAPKEIFELIQDPTTMLIASADEQFNAEPLAQYSDHLPLTTRRRVEIVDAKHLTILLQAPDLIAESIEWVASGK